MNKQYWVSTWNLTISQRRQSSCYQGALGLIIGTLEGRRTTSQAAKQMVRGVETQQLDIKTPKIQSGSNTNYVNLKKQFYSFEPQFLLSTRSTDAIKVFPSSNSLNESMSRVEITCSASQRSVSYKRDVANPNS